MPSNPRSLRINRRAASPAVSTVIITAATVVMVLVAGNYALQVIERQRASSEFETVTQSMLAFDDAVRDIAWDREGSRSVRFTTNYGFMRLLPGSKNITISTQGLSGANAGGFSRTFDTAVVKYFMPTTQFTLGSGSSFYVLGDNRSLVSSLTDSFGQGLVRQEPGFATISLNYRVRVAREGPATDGITYVDIMMIKLNCNTLSIGSGDFDLVAKNVYVKTDVYGPYTASAGAILVDSDVGNQFTLGAGTFMLNLITAEVQVRP